MINEKSIKQYASMKQERKKNDGLIKCKMKNKDSIVYIQDYLYCKYVCKIQHENDFGLCEHGVV